MCRFLCLFLLALPACQGEVFSSSGGDGDGDSAGDGDTMGDGDVSGDGDTMGDGDVIGDGDIMGDGDVIGDGDIRGDGDGIACTTNYVYGITARVVGGMSQPSDEDSFGAPPPNEEPDLPILPPPMGGAPNGGDECGATVVAFDGSYTETLECYQSFNYPGDCECYGAGERPGTYRVTATHGARMESQTAEVMASVCHVIPVNLTFFGMDMTQ